METFNEHLNRLKIYSETKSELEVVYEKLISDLDIEYNDRETDCLLIHDINEKEIIGNTFSSRHIKINSERTQKCKQNLFIFVYKDGSVDKIKIRMACAETTIDNDGFDLSSIYTEDVEKAVFNNIHKIIDFYVLGKDIEFNE